MNLRKAKLTELPAIWVILQDAIEQRKQEGSTQWQDGYPNEQTVYNDYTNGNAYVLVEEEAIVAYVAIIVGEEPAYINIEGKWLSDGAYATVHRVATSNVMKGKGIATQLFTKIEAFCVEEGVPSIKVDTNFDNIPMLKILDKLGYTYCGEVFFRGSARKAFEKLLPKVST